LTTSQNTSVSSLAQREVQEKDQEKVQEKRALKADKRNTSGRQIKL